MGKWGCREGLAGCLRVEGWGGGGAGGIKRVGGGGRPAVGYRSILIPGLHLATLPYSGKTTVYKRFHND